LPSFAASAPSAASSSAFQTPFLLDTNKARKQKNISILAGGVKFTSHFYIFLNIEMERIKKMKRQIDAAARLRDIEHSINHHRSIISLMKLKVDVTTTKMATRDNHVTRLLNEQANLNDELAILDNELG